MKPLSRSFYVRYTIDVAKDLLGKLLVRRFSDGSYVAGVIVEVEAYRGEDDPASHAYRGLTSRNKVMFGKPGVAYVYFTYGMYHCLNIVTEPEGVPAAVLIRAVEPVFGIDIMMKFRGAKDVRNLTNGPGKLTMAFNITRELNGVDMTKNDVLFVTNYDKYRDFEIESSPRIGIKVGLDKPWRFYIKGNPYVSKTRIK
jgi:DNA-3-methyladenine glycosylase